MQDRKNAGQEGSRAGEMQGKRDVGPETVSNHKSLHQYASSSASRKAQYLDHFCF